MVTSQHVRAALSKAPQGHPSTSTRYRVSLIALSTVVTVPPDWGHIDSPLHYLLAFQAGCCGICARPGTFTASAYGSICSLAQITDRDRLLLGLVCHSCRILYGRHWTHSDRPLDPMAAAFLASPPAQSCPATIGRVGAYSKPRPFKHHPRLLQEPGARWKGTNTVLHTLFLFQNRRCGICQDPLTVHSDTLSVHTDHDRLTVLVRGLLCRRCNIAQGKDFGMLDFWSCCRSNYEAYMAQPPASVCSDTRGLFYGHHLIPADISIRHGRSYIGSMPSDWCKPTRPAA